MFGDTIESIREFDEDTQKSIKNIKEVEINPYTEFLIEKDIDELPKQKYLKSYGKVSSLIDYLSEPFVFYKDYNSLKVSYTNTYNEMLEYKENNDKNYDGNYMFSLDELNPKYLNHYLTINNIISNKDITIYKIDCKEM